MIGACIIQQREREREREEGSNLELLGHKILGISCRHGVWFTLFTVTKVKGVTPPVFIKLARKVIKFVSNIPIIGIVLVVALDICKYLLY